MPKPKIRNRNETAQGPSPACLRVLHTFPKQSMSNYIDGYYSSELIPVVSKFFGVPEKQIMISDGVEGFLRTTLGSLYSRRVTVLSSSLCYYYYPELLEHYRIRLRTFRMHEDGGEYTFDIDDCIRQIRQHRPRIVLIASPNNPTGNLLAKRSLVRILKHASRDTAVMIDEAYLGFEDRSSRQDFVPLLKRFPNLILLRTFSKVYALAGLRIGYALGGKDAKQLIHYEPPYLGMSRLNERMAITALRSTRYYRDVVAGLRQTRSAFMNAVQPMRHISALQSHANFILLKMPERLAIRVQTASERLPIVIVKQITKTLVRVSLGDPAAVSSFIRMLTELDQRYRAHRML